MSKIKKWFINTHWSYFILATLTIGLAPFNPPHIWEKILMLKNMELKKIIDIFDLTMHATPWILIAIKSFIKKK